jgi:drug/metabolite transporter (DMT)-like permease
MAQDRVRDKNVERMRTVFYTILALIAFAANSVLCRMALHDGAIDAASFSSLRFAAAAVSLLIILASTRQHSVPAAGSWTSAGVLFLYSIPFSFGYTMVATGTGALILFGGVQVTMMGAAVWRGERPHWLQWLGLGLAVAGLIYLMLPGLAAPPLAGAGLMALAGFAWGIYSLRGRGSSSPMAQTAGNIVRSVPLMLGMSLVALRHFHVARDGALFAVASGAVTTGLGYVIWYQALRGLTATRAAVVQLAVPVLATAGGAIFLNEIISRRLIVAAVMVLGGIALALLGREQMPARNIA